MQSLSIHFMEVMTLIHHQYA